MDDDNILGLAPVHKLPPEILSFIFELAILPLKRSDQRGSRLVIMCVSHYWKDLAIKTVSLWTTLYLIDQSSNRLDDQGTLQEMRRTLERSKSAPLTIVWDTEHGFPVNKEAVDIVRDHIWRLVDLEVSAFMSPLISDMETILGCGGVAPTLRYLECLGPRRPMAPDELITALDLIAAPTLHAVFKRLVSLTLSSISISCVAFRVVLETCACLKGLLLDTVSISDPGSDLGSRVEMPSLHLLHFTFVESNDLRSLLHLIYPPYLRDLEVQMDMETFRGRTETGEPVGDGPIIGNLAKFLAANLSRVSSSPPRSALSALRLVSMFDQYARWGDYVQLLEATPDLRILDFHFVKFPSMINLTDAAIKAHGIMCPELIRLCMTGVSKDFPFHQLATILKQRMESGKKLPILEAYPSGDKERRDPWAETVAYVSKSFVHEVTQYSAEWSM